MDLTAYVEKHGFCFDAVLDEDVTNDEVIVLHLGLRLCILPFYRGYKHLNIMEFLLMTFIYSRLVILGRCTEKQFSQSFQSSFKEQRQHALHMAKQVMEIYASCIICIHSAGERLLIIKACYGPYLFI